MRGALGYTRNRKTEEKFIQNRKTANKICQYRKPHQNCIHKYCQIGKKIGNTKNHIGYQNWKTASIFYGIRKPDAKKRKIRKPHWTPKPKNRSLLTQKPKNRSKKYSKPQNRKSQCPPRRLVGCNLCSSFKCYPIEECLCSVMRWKKCRDVYPTSHRSHENM